MKSHLDDWIFINQIKNESVRTVVRKAFWEGKVIMVNPHTVVELLGGKLKEFSSPELLQPPTSYIHSVIFLHNVDNHSDWNYLKDAINNLSKLETLGFLFYSSEDSQNAQTFLPDITFGGKKNADILGKGWEKIPKAFPEQLASIGVSKDRLKKIKEMKMMIFSKMSRGDCKERLKASRDKHVQLLKPPGGGGEAA